MTILSFMPKTSIKLFAIFKYPFRAALLLFFSQCFILFLILCSSSCRGIGNRRSEFGGNRPLTLFEAVYDLAWKHLGAVIVKWTPSLFLFICQEWLTCTAQCQLLLETAENGNFGTESERNFLCPRPWKALMGFVTLNIPKSAIKSPGKKSASPRG